MEALLEQLKAFTSKFTSMQLLALAATFVLVVGLVVGSAWWLNRDEYVLLFDDMDADSGAQVVTRLKSMKVPYQLDAGGRAIRVRSQSVDELRLDLSSQGMPASGRIGFEIFDRTQFGATEFLDDLLLKSREFVEVRGIVIGKQFLDSGNLRGGFIQLNFRLLEPGQPPGEGTAHGGH